MNQFVLYHSQDSRTKLDDQTAWLSQKQLTALFGKAKGTISEHIKHILSTFPRVDESVKSQTLHTYRELVELGKFASNSAQHNRP